MALQQNGSPELTQCIFDSNSAGLSGGGVDYGGGMRVGIDCTARLHFCTFYNNSVYGNGGGFAANRDAAVGEGVVILKSSILFNNSATGSGDQIAVGPNGASITSISYCNVQDGLGGVGGTEDEDFTWGDGNFDGDPRFHDAEAGDFSLDYDSSCLNNGDPSDIPEDAADLDGDSNVNESITKDFGLQARKVNSNDCIDVGAFECQEVGTCVGDLTGVAGVPDGVVDTDDLLLVINRWCDAGGAADMANSDAEIGCGDGVVDDFDLDVVLNNWGECESFAPTGLPEWLQGCVAKCGEDYECLVDCIIEHFEE